jgi:hypothetical protein
VAGAGKSVTWPPALVSKVARRLGITPSRLGLTVGSSGAAGFAALASVSRISAAMVGIGLAIAGIAYYVPRAVESIWKRRPQVIKAKGEAKATVITAKSEAWALRKRTATRAKLELRARPDKIEEVLRLRIIDVDLPEGRRMSDEAVAKLLAAKTRGEATKPSGGAPPVLRSVRRPPPAG